MIEQPESEASPRLGAATVAGESQRNTDDTANQPGAPLAGNAPQQIAGHRWLELSPRVGAIVIVVAICSLCLGYTLFTDQTWEDSLITLRHSENLLNGNGLTYNLGQRVHGFTSPINVLLLTVCHFLTGQSSYAATFWLYRIFSIARFRVERCAFA